MANVAFWLLILQTPQELLDVRNAAAVCMQVQQLQEAHDQGMQALRDKVVDAIGQFATGELSSDELLGELRDLGIDVTVPLPQLEAAVDDAEADGAAEEDGLSVEDSAAQLHAPDEAACAGRCACIHLAW